MLAVLHLGGGSRQNKGRKSFSETGRVVPLVPQPLLGVAVRGLAVTLTSRAPSQGASAMEVDAVSSQPSSGPSSCRGCRLAQASLHPSFRKGLGTAELLLGVGP